MKTLYLHIGLPKTGTSAIQKFLFTNKDTLSEQGYCYERMPFFYNKIGPNRNGHFLVAKKYDPNGTYDPVQTRMHMEEGMKIVLDWFQTYDNVLLSEEDIWIVSNRKQENPLDLVLEYSQKYHFAIKVVVYLRRQDDLINSWWKQQVRARTRKPTCDWKQILTKVPPHFNINYQKVLTQMEAKIPADALIVRRYDKELFRHLNTTIYSDFIHAIGLEWSEHYTIPETLTNPSFPDSYTEIKRIFNGLNTPDSSFSDADLRYLGRLALRCTKELEHEDTSLFSKTERALFLKKYKKSNAFVAKKYFHSEEPLFSEDLPDTPKFDPTSYAHQEEMIRFFGAAFLQQRQELSALKQQLTELKTQIDTNTCKLNRRLLVL
ncbi:MAG: hypothetical protein ACI4HI_12370 [Lachnospiraceae bacterium]